MANNVSRTDVVAEARTWLGTPFKHQGCLKGVACDCIGLIKGVGLALCLADYDPDGPEATAYASYSMNPNSRRMRAGLATWLVPISVADATVADIYFMAWGREPQHVALITDKGIIHSYSAIGKVVEHALDEDWKRRIVAAYRFPYFVENT